MQEPQYIVMDANGRMSPPIGQYELFETAAQGSVLPSTKIQEVGHPTWFEAWDHPVLRILIASAGNEPSGPRRPRIPHHRPPYPPICLPFPRPILACLRRCFQNIPVNTSRSCGCRLQAFSE